MMKFLVLLLLAGFPISLFSQTEYQHWQWARSFGGSGNDQTVDMKIKNGFLYVTGTFTSPQINWDGALLTNYGGQDIFLAKLDTLGNTVWVKSFGGDGDDEVQQLELNSAGAMVLRCTSGSEMVNIGGSALNSPVNFYIVLDMDGNVSNSVALPPGATYPDIDIDNEKNIYLSAGYFYPFVFAGALIDSSFGFAGAAVLKYNSLGAAQWYKNVQVRSNFRDMFMNWDHDPNDPNSGPPYFYTSPVTGDAYASMKIEFNEADTLLGVICKYNRYAQCKDLFGDYPNDKPKAVHLKISSNGIARLTSFCTQFYTFSGGWVDDFKTAPSGHSYTTWGYHSLGGTHGFNFSREKSDVLELEKGWGYYDNYWEQSNPPPAFSPMDISEGNNYLLCKAVPGNTWPTETGNRNIMILDTNFNTIKETNIAEINSIDLSTRSMADTNAIYFGSHFSDNSLYLNVLYPRLTFAVNSNGGQDIFIGKYAFGFCTNSIAVQNIPVCRGSSYTFPDNTVLNNILADTSYTCTIAATFGCDSSITTNVRVVNIDTGITKNRLVLTAHANGSFYQWINCITATPVPSANNQTYTALAAGSYSLEVTKKGCRDTSACYAITEADLLFGGRQIISISPVPSRDYYTLTVQADKLALLNITLLDFTGTIVRQQNTNLSVGKNIITQNIHSLSPGTYTLVLRRPDTKEKITKKIIKL